MTCSTSGTNKRNQDKDQTREDPLADYSQKTTEHPTYKSFFFSYDVLWLQVLRQKHPKDEPSIQVFQQSSQPRATDHQRPSSKSQTLTRQEQIYILSYYRPHQDHILSDTLHLHVYENREM